jgi:protein-disulfide isomerase
MKDNIFKFSQILLLIAILILLIIINQNLIFFGNKIISNNNEKNVVIPRDVKLQKKTGIFAGDLNAPKTVTIFVDYDCFYCKRFFKEVYPELVNKYIKNGKIKIEFRNLPLTMHPNSLFMAKSMVCVNKYGNANDLQAFLFLNENLTQQQIKAKAIKLATKANQLEYEGCLTNIKTDELITNDIGDAAANGIFGTPSFVIDNKLYVGLMPFKEISSIIENKSLNRLSVKDENNCK